MAKRKGVAPASRFNKALNSVPKRERKTISIDQADNGYMVSLRNEDDYIVKKKQIATDMNGVKKAINEML